MSWPVALTRWTFLQQRIICYEPEVRYFVAFCGTRVYQFAATLNLTMKHEGVPSILGVAVLLSMLSMTSVSAFANTNLTPNPSQQAANGSALGRGLADPVSINIYLNGSIVSGLMGFNAKSGTQSIILKAVYPWASYPSILASSKITLTFAIYPFPADTAIPSWLHVVVSTPSLTMPHGDSSSTSLLITVDSTGPLAGTIGSFEVASHFVDPLTGYPETDWSAISLEAGPLLTTPYSPGNNPVINQKYLSSASSSPGESTVSAIPPPSSGSWAIGVGLCDSSATTKCNSKGIGWSSVTAVSSGISYPSLSVTSDTWFTVNAEISHNVFLQNTLINPYGGSNTWEVEIWYNDCTVVPCNYNHYFMASEGTSGSAAMEILYSSGWSALVGANSWPYHSWISSCCGSSTSFYGAAQEIFAFESNDVTQSHFNSMANLQSPSFEYYTGSWTNAPEGFLVNSDYSGWPSITVGNGGTTPTWFLEAGHSQCSSVSSANVQVGVSGSVCSGATNTSDTQLF